MKQEQWDELKRLHLAATRGEREFQDRPSNEFVVSGNTMICALPGISSRKKDFQCIVALHNALPAILAERDAAQKENEHLRCALRYYATGQHFMRGDNDAWDTVSGEPQNFWCDEAGTATVEDGSFAAHSLRNNMEWSAEDAAQIEGEKPYLSIATFDKESKND